MSPSYLQSAGSVTIDVSAERQLRLLLSLGDILSTSDGYNRCFCRKAIETLQRRIPAQGISSRVTTDVSAERQLRQAALLVVLAALRLELQSMFQPKGN